jgi:hypothetical protein
MKPWSATMPDATIPSTPGCLAGAFKPLRVAGGEVLEDELTRVTRA